MAGETKDNKGRNTVNHVLYTIIQWTWGCLQNIGGLFVWLVLMIINPKRKLGYYHGAIRTNWKNNYSMGLGMFIFYGHEDRADAAEVLVHEYGHTIQSCMLGPLFLFVIGLPSVVWAFTPKFAQWRKDGKYTYFDFYPEYWANKEGERVLHAPAPWK